MLYQALSIDDRQHILDKIVEKYISRGFTIISRSSTTAELNKPEGFPAFLNKAQTIFLDADEEGRVRVRKV